MTRAKEMRDLPLALDVDSSGKVLIGQTSTGAYSSADNLILGTGSGHNGMTIFSGNAHQGTIFFADALGGNSDASTYDGYIIYQHDDGALRIGTRGAERVRIDSNGNVGIGTDTPTEKLVVHGDGARLTVESADYEVAMLGRRGSSGSALDSGYLRLRKQGVTNDGVVLDTNGNSWLMGGPVGIGTHTPFNSRRRLSVHGVSTESSGYQDIVEFLEPNITGGTVSVNFGVANSLNNLAKVDFTYAGAGSTSNRVNLGFHSNDNKLMVYANGEVELINGQKLNAGGATIQTIHMNSYTHSTANPINVWAEVNSAYRIAITPKYVDSYILATYHIPINPTGASNILMAIAPWSSTNSGATQNLLSQGASPGIRHNLAVSWFRSNNGYDGNDMQNHVVHFRHDHNTTNTLTYGFQFRSEGSNNTYFCHSGSNNSTWGWVAPIYMELREIR